MNEIDGLLLSLLKIAKLQGESVDRLAFQDAVESVSSLENSKAKIVKLSRYLHLKSPEWINDPDPAAMPLLALSPDGRWEIIRGQNGSGNWISEWWDEEQHQWCECQPESLSEYLLAKLSLSKVFNRSNSPVYTLIKDEVFSNKSILFQALMAGVIINCIALAVSLYTMTVYDRVVPTGASQTLIVLTLGVFAAVLYEFLAKKTRSLLFEKLIDKVDQHLARNIYIRFLNIRLDQLPPSVGGLASQMRGYETIRGFLVGITTYLLVDFPYSLLFIGVIYLIAGELAFIPLIFLCLSVLIGMYYKNQVVVLASQTTSANSFKTGLLVESVEGAETIKSGQGGWRMLSRWMNITDEARKYELQTRNISDYSQHLVTSFQQLSYIALIAFGALQISKGELTIGSLIACSIISSRILAPVANIPRELVLWAHSKAALKALDEVWLLEDDHYGHAEPIILENIKGMYEFENVTAEYANNTALIVSQLMIKPGEKVAVLGPVGAGKTTFLRLLSGMYKPQSGRVCLDGVDLAQISKPKLAEHVGFVHQETRLFAGTVRENLILGLLDPGDEVLMEAAHKTGLMQSVIATHPLGLHRPINEGGTGLSGGQRQLLNFTRAILRKPDIWLLDEPTASMDQVLERRVKEVLVKDIKETDTMILVTHKIDMLELADRIIMISNNKIVMDGPKDAVLAKLYGTDTSTKEQRI